MSADNWTACPRCTLSENTKVAAEVARVMALYGKIPIAEFDAQRYTLQNRQPLENTFREDWAIGLRDGNVFHVEYRGNCQKCGLTVEFTHNQRVKL